MIYEVRTYTLRPGTVAEFEERFAKRLPLRREALQARGLLAHRVRAAQSGYPRLSLRRPEPADVGPRRDGRGQLSCRRYPAVAIWSWRRRARS